MPEPYRLHHYTHNVPSKLVTSDPVRPDLISAYEKPEGFWLSDDSDDCNWVEFCVSEEFNVGGLAYRMVFDLDMASILHIKTHDELIEFTHKYGVKDTIFRWGSDRYAIVWANVYKDYDGILITPYIGSARMLPETTWYYGWDVASACIWKTETLTLITVEDSSELIDRVKPRVFD